MGKTPGLQVSEDLMWAILLLRTLSGWVLPTSMQDFHAALALLEEQGLQVAKGYTTLARRGIQLLLPVNICAQEKFRESL